MWNRIMNLVGRKEFTNVPGVVNTVNWDFFFRLSEIRENAQNTASKCHRDSHSKNL